LVLTVVLGAFDVGNTIRAALGGAVIGFGYPVVALVLALPCSCGSKTWSL
jgi:hypothetical protein